MATYITHPTLPTIMHIEIIQEKNMVSKIEDYWKPKQSTKKVKNMWTVETYRNGKKIKMKVYMKYL